MVESIEIVFEPPRRNIKKPRKRRKGKKKHEQVLDESVEVEMVPVVKSSVSSAAPVVRPEKEEEPQNSQQKDSTTPSSSRWYRQQPSLTTGPSDSHGEAPDHETDDGSLPSDTEADSPRGTYPSSPAGSDHNKKSKNKLSANLSNWRSFRKDRSETDKSETDKSETDDGSVPSDTSQTPEAEEADSPPGVAVDPSSPAGSTKSKTKFSAHPSRWRRYRKQAVEATDPISNHTVSEAHGAAPALRPIESEASDGSVSSGTRHAPEAEEADGPPGTAAAPPSPAGSDDNKATVVPPDDPVPPPSWFSKNNAAARHDAQAAFRRRLQQLSTGTDAY
eukprot:CAMPEP_0194312354 /NCGR_PEP_ID=MMETSP0171-20130528/9281_1 /TAXON_ID=218684 /ORGANISM="Corethron pennatum, Strain L29A3" /LENGTH=332 /DNA_ID=CAMNT_0039066837 /DNA_START=123 /DNA_END=1121 /DNA_ORIENTATION=+